MEKVRIGIIGIGCMGSCHATQIFEGKVKGLVLTAVCDIDEKRIQWAKEKFGDQVKYFNDAEEMMDVQIIDAILIATPHIFHPELASLGFEKGLHVLTEKPAGVDTYNVKKMIASSKKSDVVFAIMLNQRMNPLYQKLKIIIADGELGNLKRFVWIINNWYRTQCYYDAGDWRATWSGEGGGVLINQCPHNLDLWQWMIGMPDRLKAVCNEGKYHNIQVEDEATIYAEYDNGLSAIFVTSTGEYPGTNRIEVSGTKGKAVLENGVLTLSLIEEDERTLCFNSEEKMPNPKVITKTYTMDEPDQAHLGILQNFTNAILYGEELISPGADGLNELMLSNAAYLAAWKDKWVKLPLDDKEYLAALDDKRWEENKNIAKNGKTLEVVREYTDRWQVRW